MPIVALFLAVVASVFAQDSSWQITPEVWQQSEEQILRLPPTAFPDLSSGVIEDLKKRGCTIPQAFPGAYGYSTPLNVIRGEFAKRGQKDLAILCSRKKPPTAYDLYSQGSHHTIQRSWASSILVYFGGSTTNVSEIGERYDMDDQVGMVETLNGQFAYRKLGYTRILRAVDAKYILDHYAAYGDAYHAFDNSDHPPIDHEGIDDPIQEKASTVHYYFEGKWLQLPGAD